ncbi:phage major capsid protein [Aminobacter carboxidus]|uniref:Phage major capsid protein n=1 Tax=Aminobacter carboxidus TaxID=376165 RepID=A0ABR9GWR6_9HYPH|nr:phage major capsid protein [Aminobacter carboxidus]MBE1208116.1 phage major capsid protein [Aminobacter carboxidus]
MSKDLASLRQNRATAYDALIALGTPEAEADQTAFDAAATNVENLDRQIKSMERAQALKGSTAVPAAPRQDPSEAGSFDSFGEQLLAVARAGNGGERDPRLVWQSIGAASGQNEGSGPDGGFLVQQDFTSELLKKAYERSDLASRTRKIPLGPNSNGLRMNAVKETSRANGSRFGGIQAFWTGEGAQKTASQLQFRQMDLRLHKLTGLLYATDENLEDATSLEAIINEAFEEEFAFKIDWAVFEGTGAGMPLGVTKSPALVTVSKEGSQVADSLVAENILKMWARLWVRSRKNAIWTINQQLEPQLYQMNVKIKNVAGTENVGGIALPPVVYVPPGGQNNNNDYGLLMGRPVIPTEFNSAPGDKGDIVLMDLKEYLMIDKGAAKKATSIHVKFITDETAFRFVVRIDGQPVWESPLTPFKGSDTLSPYVTLEAR